MTLRSGRGYVPRYRERDTYRQGNSNSQRYNGRCTEVAPTVNGRSQREREFDEQRKWREEAQVQQGKDSKRHNEARAYMYLDLIAKLAETRKAYSTKPAGLRTTWRAREYRYVVHTVILISIESFGRSGNRCEGSKAHRGSSSGGEPNGSGVLGTVMPRSCSHYRSGHVHG